MVTTPPKSHTEPAAYGGSVRSQALFRPVTFLISGMVSSSQVLTAVSVFVLDISLLTWACRPCAVNGFQAATAAVARMVSVILLIMVRIEHLVSELRLVEKM